MSVYPRLSIARRPAFVAEITSNGQNPCCANRNFSVWAPGEITPSDALRGPHCRIPHTGGLLRVVPGRNGGLKSNPAEADSPINDLREHLQGLPVEGRAEETASRKGY